MTEREVCSRCELLLPTAAEKSALAKLKPLNYKLWDKLRWRRCTCITHSAGRPEFGGRRIPLNLDIYDRNMQ